MEYLIVSAMILETKGCTIPSFHIDAFILKVTLMAEWTSEKEFDRPSRKVSGSYERLLC